jgi:hypothetical protein
METREMNWKRGRCRHSFWKCVGIGFLGIVGFIAFTLVIGYVIMWLWNGLMPQLFHLAVITFWQAVGLAVLARLIFGASHMGHRHWSHRRWRHHRGHHCGCGTDDHSHDSKDDGCRCNSDRWKYYDQYWEEEGGKSFDDFVKRKTDNKENA